MDNAKETSNPIGTSCYLDKDESCMEVNQTMCRGMIGSLLYESIDSLPIAWTVGAMIYFTNEVSGSSPGWPSCIEEKNRKKTDQAHYNIAGKENIFL